MLKLTLQKNRTCMLHETKTVKKRYLKECGKDHVFKIHNLGWSDSLNVKLTGWWAESTAPMGRLNSLSKTDKLLLTIRRIDTEDHIRQAQPHNQNVCPCLEALREAMSVFFGYGFLHKWGNGEHQCPKMTTTWQLQYLKHGKARVWIAGFGDSLFLAWTNPYLEPSWVQYATFEFPPFWGSPWVNWHSQGHGRSVLLGWSSLGLEPLGAPRATHAASGWGAASGWWQRPEERLLLKPPGNGWDDWVPVNRMHRVATPSLIPQSRDYMGVLIW